MQLLLEAANGQPDPSQLTTASGVVVYRLRNWGFTSPFTNDAPQPIGYDILTGDVAGIVAVQVNGDGSLMIEPVPGATDPASFKAFSNARRTYRR